MGWSSGRGVGVCVGVCTSCILIWEERGGQTTGHGMQLEPGAAVVLVLALGNRNSPLSVLQERRHQGTSLHCKVL